MLSEHISKESAQSEREIVWVKDQVYFDGASIDEVGKFIESRYTVKVKIDELLSNLSFTGLLPTNNLASALEILRFSLNITIEENQDMIVFKKQVR